MSQITCALAQLQPTLFDKDGNLERVCSVLADAAKNGARVAVFPELFLTGYFLRGATRSLAEPVDGPGIRRLAAVARENEIVVLIGFPELHLGEVFNAVAVIDSTGEILGSYRKVHLYGIEGQYFVAGNQFPVFATSIGTLGVQICFDLEFPESARALALNGASILVCCSANMLPFQHYQHIYWQARAMENHAFHVLVNRTGQEEDTTFFGGSGIAGPLGTIVVKADDQEGVFYGTFNLKEIEQSISTLDYLNNRHPSHYGDLTQ